MPVLSLYRPALLAASGLIALSATPAMAGAPHIGWENPELSIYGGPVITYESLTLSDTAVSQGLTTHGMSYGGLVGMDSRTGERSRVGLEAELSGSTASWSETQAGVGTARIGLGRDFFIGGKLGYMLAPRLYAYAKAGYTNLLVTADFTDTTGFRTHGSFSNSGWRGGAGLEYFLSKNARLRVEYRYSSYGDLSINGVKTGLTLDKHQVATSMTYGF
ncbi:outer membrane protein [Novosphingobium sediminicola]|uniref:Outer membrane immunogenic protein n=1 Tax=Novosphingobium sediminicola TaxID=563162 RepID=A0A7W6CD52_9SPHN|nr:outer membrane beta-barrel protein [Novosphingobium sediminicola]MBB3953235.1 outer membrane immunogenic protein [Novosphingobium sediminicola]